MFRTALEAEYQNRLLILLLLVMLVFFLGGMTELYHRQIDLVELDVKAAVVLIASLFPAAVVNSLPALAALAAIPWLASRFIHALYGTKDLREAHSFLHRNVFGMAERKPALVVKEGRITDGAGSLCDRVGGRGALVVQSDSAVVLEKGGHLTRVVGPSLSFPDRFERVWEVIDLRVQRWPLTVDAMTKEGIPVSCQVDVTFKIDDRFVDQDGFEQTKLPIETEPQLFTDEAIDAALEEDGIETPLPYTDEAVFKAATGIWVRIRQPDHPEQLRRWTGRVVIGEVEGALRSILARYRLDWLMQPPRPGHKPPREEIRGLLERKLRDALPVDNQLGARIIRVDLGKIDVKDEKISTQWIEAWQAGWEQRAVESRAEGETELARLQAAQVQAQAEMVLALTEAIRPLVTSEEELSSYALATRFVETLWWMSYSPGTRAFLPPDAMWTLKELQKMLGEGEGVPPEEPPRGSVVR